MMVDGEHGQNPNRLLQLDTTGQMAELVSGTN